METPDIIMWLAVIVAGGFSAFRNPSAAVLVLAWMAGTAVSVRTGDPTPIGFYPFADIAAISIIMCKDILCNDERTVADRTVILLFAVCWLFYVAPIHDYYLYWALWVITLTQFLAVGVEPFLPAIRRLAATVIRSPDHPGTLLVAYPAGGKFG